MQIKTGYQNLLHSSGFLCVPFSLINIINQFEKCESKSLSLDKILQSVYFAVHCGSPFESYKKLQNESCCLGKTLVHPQKWRI